MATKLYVPGAVTVNGPDGWPAATVLVPTIGSVHPGSGLGPTRVYVTVPVADGPPGGGMTVAKSVTVVPGGTSALVEAWVTSVGVSWATATFSPGAPHGVGPCAP
ncbi:MAG TPA: hypothetical protein VHF27_10265 [Acidimicrobiales bacterium]|nr:hypothetical protein [Acidimicrobiales bacterium]